MCKQYKVFISKWVDYVQPSTRAFINLPFHLSCHTLLVYVTTLHSKKARICLFSSIQQCQISVLQQNEEKGLLLQTLIAVNSSISEGIWLLLEIIFLLFFLCVCVRSLVLTFGLKTQLLWISGDFIFIYYYVFNFLVCGLLFYWISRYFSFVYFMWVIFREKKDLVS